MSTTIDSLNIEIQSNSTNAASGIDALAKALKKLNKNGDVSGAITTLNDLRKSLHAFANVPSSASKIESLANSLNSLKKVGTINLGSSLDGVKKAMESLKSIDVDGVAPQIERIAQAMTPFNSVKGSGFKSAVDGLKNLDSVTKSLNEEVIGEFIKKVKELDEALGPLSQKMTSIQGGFKALGTAIKQTNVSVKQANAEVKVNVFNLSNLINVAQSVVQVLNVIVQKLQAVIGEAIEWDGIAQRFGRGFGENAEEVYSWVQRLNEEMGINIQQFMQYSSTYATMLTGFGVASKDASKMALGYMELTYDIWAGYNDIYKNFSDAADAVRSAIAGEVEPIRRAGFTIVESTLEETAARHGLTISIEKATEAQKSYLRYLTLVDQAHSQSLVGTYAKEMNTAEGQIRTLTQQLKSLSQTFGSVFLPILVKIVPWLQAFVDLLGDAIIAAANFFGIDIQKIDPDSWGAGALDGVGESANGATGAVNETTAALKDLKNATTGIDELNIISPQSESGGGSGGGTGSGNGFDGLDVDSLWDESIFDTIQNQTEEIKQKIKDMMPTITAFSVALAGLTVAKLLSDLDTVSKKITGLGKGLTVGSIAIAVGALVWDFTGAYLESGNWMDWLAGLGTTAIGTGLAYKFGGKGGAGITLTVSGIAMLSRLVFDLSQGTVDFGDKETWITMATGGIETLIGGIITWKVLGPKITAAVKGLFSGEALTSIGTTISTALSGGWTKIIAALSNIPVWGWIAAAVIGLIAGAIGIAVADYDFTDVGKALGKAVGFALKYLNPIGWFAQIGLKFWGAVIDAIKAVAEWLKDIDSWSDFWESLKEVGWNIFGGIIEGFTSGNFTENIKEFFTGFWEGLCEAFGIHSPAKSMYPIGENIVAGIWSGISGVKDWIVEKVSKWAKDLVDDIAEKMNPNAIRDKLSTMWTNAKNWWNNSKSALAAYTPNIGNIKDKLSSVWTTAKNWWNKSKGTLSYTPSFGSIKDKLVSAWNTAKSWWNKNVKLSVPSLSLKVTYTTKGLNTVQKAIVSALGLSGWPKLSFAANGGIFDMGSLVWAGEAGPEIVANAGGGKTGVMNVQQMSEAVYEGVYAAVVSAMRSSNGNSGNAQAVNVYLDGKQIYSSMEQHRKERGASLMGNQVYSY